MPKTIAKMPLRQIDRLPPGLYAVAPGGLYIAIGATGSRSWIFRYCVAGRKRDFGLGSCRDLSRDDAEIEVQKLRVMVRRGEDPIDAKGEKQHLTAMDYQEVPAFVAKLRERDAAAAKALEFLILCASRSAEVRDSARKYRVGIVAQEFAGQPERAATGALEIAADAFQRAGNSVRQLRLPEIFAEAWRNHSIVQAFEAHQSLSWEYNRHHEALPPRLRGKLDSTLGIGRAEYDDALSVARRAL